jgi:hypothetical protein
MEKTLSHQRSRRDPVNVRIDLGDDAIFRTGGNMTEEHGKYHPRDASYGFGVLEAQSDLHFDDDEYSLSGETHADTDISTGLFTWRVPQVVSFSSAGNGFAERRRQLIDKACEAARNRSVGSGTKTQQHVGTTAVDEDAPDMYCEFSGAFQTLCKLEEGQVHTAVTLVLGLGDTADLLVPTSSLSPAATASVSEVRSVANTHWSSSSSDAQDQSQGLLTMRLVEPQVANRANEVVFAMRYFKVIHSADYCYAENVIEWLSRPTDRVGVWQFTPRSPGSFIVYVHGTTFKVHVHGKTKPTSNDIISQSDNTMSDVNAKNKNINNNCLLLNNLGTLCVKDGQFTAALALRSVDAALDLSPRREALALRVEVVGASEQCEVHVVAGRLISPGSTLGQGIYVFLCMWCICVHLRIYVHLCFPCIHVSMYQCINASCIYVSMYLYIYASMHATTNITVN